MTNTPRPLSLRIFEAKFRVRRQGRKLLSLLGLVLCTGSARGCLLSFDDYPLGNLCDAGPEANTVGDPVLRGCARTPPDAADQADLDADADADPGAGAAAGSGGS